MHAHLEQRIEVDRMKREQILKSYEAYRAGKALSGTKIAVASKGMGLVNEHFGHAKEFLVYEVQEDGSLKLLGARKVELYCAKGSDCEEEESAQTKMGRTLKALEGVQALFVMAIGPAPEQALLEAGIEVVRQIGPIEEAFMAWAKEKISIPALEEQANRAVS
jgi:nitrogen fixation protein NifB